MQATASEKTFHLKWNNHLQNLSQLFTTIYSSSALADVTLSCRDGTIKAHKLVLSACSPYFEQLFKENPCKHPIVILKGIPYSEIHLLVEFMYKGSVDVQELDLQSLMHTASELEIRGLAYELRANASQLLNVNLEFPPQPEAVYNTPMPVHNIASLQQTDMDRLKQIHMYQQSMVRNVQQVGGNQPKKRRLEEPDTVLTPISEPRKHLVKVTTSMQTEDTDIIKDDFQKAKKKVSFGCVDIDGKRSSLGATTIMPVNNSNEPVNQQSSIKVVQLSTLQGKQFTPQPYDHSSDSEGSEANNLLQEKSSRMVNMDEGGQETETSEESQSDEESGEEYQRPHKCDICEMRFNRASHLARHRISHTGERPYNCGGCGRSFTRSDKLKIHQRMCEKEDPTINIGGERKSKEGDEVRSGTVRLSHRDSSQLVFTPSGEVLLAPKAEANTSRDINTTDMLAKRGRGRPRKNPLPEVPKIKKKRGRPPKYTMVEQSMETDECSTPEVVTSLSLTPNITGGPIGSLSLTVSPVNQQDAARRRRGRPPKNFFQNKSGDPKENYNATNLPFGDFSVLMYNTQLAYANQLQTAMENNLITQDDKQDDDKTTDDEDKDTTNTDDKMKEHSDMENMDQSDIPEPERTIDLSSSSSDEIASETTKNKSENQLTYEMKTVGDCAIIKLPVSTERRDETNVNQSGDSAGIIKSIGDCTIEPISEKPT